MKDVMLFFLSLMLTALGLVVAVATVFWWALLALSHHMDLGRKKGNQNSGKKFIA